MLLLVLILVLIAFGLLLVGFLTSSVLWAWVSVAVSVGAALVLIYDTVRRRSVVRAGDNAGGDPASGPPAAPSRSAATGVGAGHHTPTRAPVDPDPATEVLPVIWPAAVRSGAPAPGAGPRFDPHADSQQTVMMPVVRPPGSPSGPSGATSSITGPGESMSPTVVVSVTPQTVSDTGRRSTRTDRTTAEAPDAGADPAAAPTWLTPLAPPPDAAEVNLAKTDAPPAAEELDPSKKGGRSAGGVTAAAGALAATSAFAGRPPAGPDPEATTVASAPDPATPDRTPDAGSTTVVAASASHTAPPAETPGSLFSSPPEGRGSGPADAAPGFGPAGPPPRGLRAADPGPTSSTDPTQDGPPAQGDLPRQDLAADESSAADGEAPEERSDPAAAVVVAGLDDEVVVVDEQPRYHVTGCRALVAVAPIPLPAREAVELGFTPCGWCSPDRTLAGRHPATAR